MIPQSTEAVLRDLGARVQELRKGRGLSRQALSDLSTISPRYLAQLESGSGNISVGLLHRVALALETPLPTLFESPVGKAQRICLIGLRGAGKSTLGKAVAHNLGLPFVELSEEIAALAGIPGSEVIALYGATGYRRLEAEALTAVTERYEAVILAVAGGIVDDASSFSSLLSTYHTVWLQAEPEDHMSRVRAQGDLRPMQGNSSALEELREILKARTGNYSKAELTFNTSGLTADGAAKGLTEQLLPLIDEWFEK